jgi:hypothetical protein
MKTKDESFPTRSNAGNVRKLMETTTYDMRGKGYINIPPLGAGDLNFVSRLLQ